LDRQFYQDKRGQKESEFLIFKTGSCINTVLYSFLAIFNAFMMTSQFYQGLVRSL